jgi:hypothetical protein
MHVGVSRYFGPHNAGLSTAPRAGSLIFAMIGRCDQFHQRRAVNGAYSRLSKQRNAAGRVRVSCGLSTVQT